MSRAPPPFIFGAGAGQAAPAFPSPHQQNGNHNHNTAAPPSFSNSASSLPPPPTPHAAFQQNGQLPGIDMSALAGVSPDQVALIARLLQTGAFPPPPPPPVPPAQQHASAPVTPADPRQSQPENKQQEGSDTDCEEGEVEDGEAGNSPPQSTRRGFSRAPPTGPRDATIEPSREHQAKKLVLTLHQAGFLYDDLAQTPGVDPTPLRRMFRQLGLPLSSRPDLPSGGQSASGSSLQHDPSRSLHASTAEVSQKPSPVAKAPAPGKLDRTAYLAKLQAAKAGKAGPTSVQPASASGPQEQPLKEPSTPAKLPPSAVASGTSPTVSSTSKAVKTELARQRLEAFRAEQAAKQQNKSLLATTPPSSSPAHLLATVAPTGIASPAAVSQNGLGVGLDKVSAVAGHETASTDIQDANQPPPPYQQNMSSAPATPDSAFGGLPGLFMNVAPQQASPQSTATPTRTLSQPVDQLDASSRQSNLARKRLADIESDRVAPQAKRPFGQSRSASEDESFIIENSDDEDDGLPMDVGAKIETIRTSLQSGSQPSAPEASTPSAKVLEQKVKAIEDLNRKIAEREARAKAQSSLQANNPTGSDAVNGTTTSGIPGISSSTLPNATVEGQAVAQGGSSTPQEKPLKQQKEELRQRISELENAHVSGHDAGGSGANSMPASNAQANAQSSVDAIKKSTLEDESTDALVVEDDDAASESDFDFYGNEEAPETEMPAVASNQGGFQAGATTAQANAESPSSTPLMYPQESVEDVDMVEAGAFRESGPRDTEMSIHNQSGPVSESSESADVNNDAYDLEDAQSQGSEADIEMQSDESESDDESDEDSSSSDERTDAANVNDHNISSMDGAVSSDSDEEEPGPEDPEDQDPQSDVQSGGRSGDATASQPEMPADDGLAPELQPAPEHAPAETSDQPTSSEPKHKYTPYESVLRMFHDYRFHPQYLETCPDGYRSLSYNHQIKYWKQMCDIETLEARDCDRADCPHQHFDDMKISDSVLLQRVGTKNIPTRSKDGIQRWNTGLQQLIQRLKAANVRDANDIAIHIAQYRRDFVRDEYGDPSRIIHPGDW